MSVLLPSESPGTEAPAVPDLGAAMLAAHLRDEIRMAAATTPRSLQDHVGASDIGSLCDRQIAYRARDVPPVNFPDPWPTILGSGIHAILAEFFRRRDGGSRRYLVEHPVTYRGVPGTVDLFDRWSHTVTDWKSTRKTERAIRASGPSRAHVVQAHIYGAALRAAGEDVDAVSLVYLRTGTDASLADLFAWRAPLDIRIADDAIDRYLALRVTGPAAAEPRPSRLCPWCDHYRPGATNPAVACPGEQSPDPSPGKVSPS